jgi:hypothetical protein
MRRATTPLVASMAALALALAVAGCGADDDAGAGGTSPTGSTQAVVCPQGAGEKSFDANSLVGMPLGQAEKTAADHGCTVRPVKVDGKDRAVTMDLRQDRINVEVEEGKVTVVEGVY